MYEEASAKIIMILATLAIVTVPSSLLQVSHAQSNQDLANKILEVHNKERAAVRVEPLTWSDSIAATAQTWAQQIATTGIFDHDPVYTGPSCTGPCYGENIAGFFNDVSEPNGGQSKWAMKSPVMTAAHAATPRCIDHHHAARQRSLHSNGLADHD